MQPFQYDLRSSAAKDSSITHAAAAPSNLDAAIPMRSAEAELQNTNRTMRNGVGNCSSKTGSRRQSRKKTILKHFLKGFLKGKLLAPKLRKSAGKSLSQPGCIHYNAFRSITALTRISLRAWQHQMTTIMQPFQYDLQPQLQEPHRTTHTGTTTRCKTHRRNNSRQKRPQPHPPHRRGTFHRRLQPLYTEKHKVSCSGFLPKT